MKKNVLSLMLALCLILSVLAVPAMAEGAKTEVVIWHTFTNDQQTALEKFAADFNASQTEYEVVVKSQEYSGFTDTVYQATANGVGPSIIFNYGSEAAKYVPDGKVVNLAPYIHDAEIGMEDVYNSLPKAILEEVEGFEKEGVYYLPAVTTGPILFVNKTIYDEMGFSAPTTWDELAQQSKAIAEKKGIQGFAADSLTDLMMMFIMQSGGSYIDVANKTVLFDTDATKAWLKWYGDNTNAGYFLDGPTIDNYISSDFNAGNVASYAGSCAGYPYIKANGFEWTMAPLPNKIDAAWYPSWNRGPIVFDKGEAVNKGAYLFVKYLLTPEVNTAWADAMTALSPYGTTQESEVYKAYIAGLEGLKADSLNAVSANLDVAGAMPNITGAAKVRDFLKEAMQKVGGGLDAETALKDLVEKSNAALKGE